MLCRPGADRLVYGLKVGADEGTDPLQHCRCAGLEPGPGVEGASRAVRTVFNCCFSKENPVLTHKAALE